MTGPRNDVVRAAGGVVYRQHEGGAFEVLVVHRPQYDDWSLPKGKCEPGEDEPAAAVREVEEETGYRCTIGPELEPHLYLDRKRRPKRVRWFLMTARDTTHWEPNEEVDERRWITSQAAQDLLTYPADRALIEALEHAATETE